MQTPGATIDARNRIRRDGFRSRVYPKLPWVLWSIAVIPSLGTIAFYAQFDFQTMLLTALTLLLYPTVGVLIASRRPENPLGWVFCVTGAIMTIADLGEAYMKYGLSKHPLPAEAWIGWASLLFAFPVLFTLFVSLCLLFPTGRLLSRRWRPLAWLSVGYIVATFVIDALSSEFVSDSSERLRSPVYSTAAARFFDVVQLPYVILGVILLGGLLLSLILRFRRSHGIERLQLKWFVYVLAISIALFLASGITAIIDPTNQGGFLGSVFWMTSLIGLESGIPAVVAIAILRYRLYDIDRIINRTLVYASLSAILIGLDAVLVIGLEHILSPVISGSSLIVAGSTLAVAALIRPVRSRVQTVVDRRFYRHKYDAARTLEAFSLRLRDQTDLTALATELGSVVHETMQPEHVSLWLREVPDRSRIVSNRLAMR